ncbi:tRNA(Ile)-lysidine synthase TilS/MesJ [Ruminococcus flavefaciens]|uniref:tRNA(Ile)-lysidine synthase TilS/MesJ n=1 Tax=Ruminococcus flavefaciens TaxID=1265 RepID=A0A1H6JIM9_RUMFL|nr:ATP-binding protein [Ruminococcus flavefaciens]SEH62135.1 tRNA(Ile)-lysidine synthase TilS/MesJ [Ruminococcus flavefaciens]
MDINIDRSLTGEFSKSIWSKFRKGIDEYKMIENGDRIAVCISGGKDSMLMAKCLMRLQKYGSINFDTEYIVMDPGYTEEHRSKIIANAELLNIPVKIMNTRIFESTAKAEKHPCFLCARLRRGWLYKTAQELGCNKIALGHHFDDVIETILMGMLYGSQIQTMMPKIHSENYENVQVIRPLYLVREDDIIKWSEYNDLHFIQCACRITRSEGSSKRAEVKQLLKTLREVNPSVDMNIFRSVENVNLQTLISYHRGSEYHHFLDDFDKGLSVKGTNKFEDHS